MIKENQLVIKEKLAWKSPGKSLITARRPAAAVTGARSGSPRRDGAGYLSRATWLRRG